MNSIFICDKINSSELWFRESDSQSNWVLFIIFCNHQGVKIPDHFATLNTGEKPWQLILDLIYLFLRLWSDKSVHPGNKYLYAIRSIAPSFSSGKAITKAIGF